MRQAIAHLHSDSFAPPKPTLLVTDKLVAQQVIGGKVRTESLRHSQLNAIRRYIRAIKGTQLLPLSSLANLSRGNTWGNCQMPRLRTYTSNEVYENLPLIEAYTRWHGRKKEDNRSDTLVAQSRNVIEIGKLNEAVKEPKIVKSGAQTDCHECRVEGLYIKYRTNGLCLSYLVGPDIFIALCSKLHRSSLRAQLLAWSRDFASSHKGNSTGVQSGAEAPNVCILVRT